MTSWEALYNNQSKRSVWPKGLLFDIGANVGSYAEYAIDHGTESVVLVEANPNLIPVLHHKFDSMPNVAIVERAISDRPDEKVKFYLSNIHTISTLDKRWVNNSRFSDEFQWNEGVDVFTVTIDQLVQHYGFPNRIKIDVEGYEYFALLGMSERYGCSELSFEWAEETKPDIIKSIQHLYNIGFTNFGYTCGEGEDGIVFDLYPSEFKTCDELIAEFDDMLDSDRKVYWGMVFAT